MYTWKGIDYSTRLLSNSTKQNAIAERGRYGTSPAHPYWKEHVLSPQEPWTVPATPKNLNVVPIVATGRVYPMAIKVTSAAKVSTFWWQPRRIFPSSVDHASRPYPQTRRRCRQHRRRRRQPRHRTWDRPQRWNTMTAESQSTHVMRRWGLHNEPALSYDAPGSGSCYADVAVPKESGTLVASIPLTV